MKNLFLLLMLLSPLFAGAAVLTVDNTPGADAMYADLSSALSAADSLDTIQVHPSPYNYGYVLVQKHVVLVGPGYHSRPDGLNAQVGYVRLENGSSGTVITGFYVTGRITVAGNQVANNISILNNFFYTSIAIEGGYQTMGESDNWLIEGNVFIHDGSCGGCKLINLQQPTNNDNWIFRNNFIQGRSGGYDELFQYVNASTTFINNIIVYRTDADIFDGMQSTFTNNIFYTTSGTFTDVDAGCTSCVFKNNLTYNTSATLDPLPGTGNIDNQDPQYAFISGSQALWNLKSDYRLQASSPGHNAGTDTTDVGVYGAGYNFRNIVIPNDFPRIEEMNVTNPIVPQGQDLIINIKAKKAGL